MADSKVVSKSKPGSGKQKQQRSPAGTAKIATSSSPATTAKQASAGTKRSRASGNKPKLSPEERNRMIAVAAYYRAEQRGFQCRCSEQDWFDAAAEIDHML